MADEALKKDKIEIDNKQKGYESRQKRPSGQNQGRAQQRRRTPPYRSQGRGGYQQRMSGNRRGGGYRRGYRARRKVCAFCADKTKVIGWKEANRLRRFVNDGGGIRSRRKTGTCAKHQRRLAVAIKRARHMALLPYTIEHVRIMGKG